MIKKKKTVEKCDTYERKTKITDSVMSGILNRPLENFIEFLMHRTHNFLIKIVFGEVEKTKPANIPRL